MRDVMHDAPGRFNTMTRIHLDELFAPGALDAALAAGYVRAQRHPELDLVIYNYTPHTQFDRHWTDVTMTCRGLVVDGDGYVLARPWRKFFNHGEHERDTLPTGESIQVLDKLDGSLGIVVPDPRGGHLVATRGSFTSEQARHASETWQRRYAAQACLDPELTYLVEILYPANRIVVDYHGLDDLVLLGAVHTATGRSVDVTEVPGWPGPRVEVFEHPDLASVLGAAPRPGAEGFVIWFRDSDLRVKLKQEEYLRLHKLLTDVSERRIWEALSAGVDIAAWLEDVPDEFYTYVTRVVDDLRRRYRTLRIESYTQFLHVLAGLPDGWGRKDFALAVGALAYEPKSVLFSYLDGRDVTARLWAELRPEEHIPVFAQRGDAD